MSLVEIRVFKLMVLFVEINVFKLMAKRVRDLCDGARWKHGLEVEIRTRPFYGSHWLVAWGPFFFQGLRNHFLSCVINYDRCMSADSTAWQSCFHSSKLNQKLSLLLTRSGFNTVLFSFTIFAVLYFFKRQMLFWWKNRRLELWNFAVRDSN